MSQHDLDDDDVTADLDDRLITTLEQVHDALVCQFAAAKLGDHDSVELWERTLAAIFDDLESAELRRAIVIQIAEHALEEANRLLESLDGQAVDEDTTVPIARPEPEVAASSTLRRTRTALAVIGVAWFVIFAGAGWAGNQILHAIGRLVDALT